MNNGKIDTSLWLAYSLPENLREHTEGLNVGFDRETRQWELLVKYHGDLVARQEEVPFVGEYLTGDFAIVFLKEENLIEFSNLQEVDYIEQPKRLWFSLQESRAEICLNEIQRDANLIYTNQPMVNTGSQNLFGEGVLIAIIDSSVDYAHPDFRNSDGTTRILALWDQTINSEELNSQEDSAFVYAPPEGFVLGILFTQEMINTALEQKGRIEQEKIVPSVDLSGHGTHVAGIACGNGRVSNGRYRGVAPLSSMLVVKLGDFYGVSFPRTTRLMEAVEFAVRFAEQRGMPVAVNLSFGNNYGSHTGNDLVAAYLDQIASCWKNVICTGMGNEGNTGRHKESVLEERKNEEVEMAIGGGQESFNLQLWKNYEDEFQVEIISPLNEHMLLRNNENRVFFQEFSDCVLAVNYGTPNPFQILQEIYMEWIPKQQFLESGIWKFRLIPEKIVQGRYDFWMPAGSYVQAQTRFLAPSAETTLTIPATTNRLISVGAYDGGTEQIAPFSGRGYTRNYQIKPDVVAPGVGIMSTAPNNSYAVRSGTSMAAPFVTGAAALLMEYGILRQEDPYLYGEKAKVYLRKGAKPVRGEALPGNRQGFGVICVADSLK